MPGLERGAVRKSVRRPYGPAASPQESRGDERGPRTTPPRRGPTLGRVYVGILRLALRVHAAQSLKDRRRSVTSLIARVRNRFNVAAADVDEDPGPSAATVAVVCVANDPRYLDGLLRKVVDFAEALHLDLEVVDEQIEILQL